MRITRLSRQRRNNRRLSVYLDGQYSFSLSEKSAADFGLALGQELSQDDIDRITKGDELRRAKEYAVLLLSYRARTMKEIRARLAKKGFPDETIEAALRRLAELKLVDDTKFARDYTESRIRAAGRSRRLVKVELARLGVAKPEIDAALKEAPDEAVAARELVAKYAKRYARLDEKTRRQRLYALLARRGFAYDTIRKVLGVEADPEV